MDSPPRPAAPPEILTPELLAALLEEIDEGIYVVDRERRILYWNHGAEQITGYLAQEVTGRACQSDLLMHCDAEGNVLCGSGCPLAGVMEDGAPREVMVFLRHRDGHRLPVRVRARPLRDAEGRIVGALELFGPVALERERPGAVTREFAEWELAHALATQRRFGHAVAWMGIELDHAAEWEHRFGPGFVEAAMLRIAETLEANLDARDRLVRWSRTAFRVLLRDAGLVSLAELGQRLAMLVRASSVPWWGDACTVTVSVAAAPAGEQETVESLEGKVSELLAQCRARGGDCAEPRLSRPGGLRILP
jgi:PAS domain S-box-containing protein